ncbi:YtfJ family protein [Hydrogenimonas thermophila]|uniref:Uncharacterized protein n=1 Tax=Hydrogenimonas thermophila TaxID=223786 RepID=A0A1I5U9F3_9BACT|nr:YtfJ family protein [Hydrogenimonas thermophila]SFP91872.1 hypothetical protein SAMN05216234_1572 [Hydrogenimonas thermophila]
MKRFALISMILVFTTVNLFAVKVGEILPHIILSVKNGGLYDNRAWDCNSLKGKWHILLYMDPDAKEEAMPFIEKLNRANLSSKRYSTIAIVNLAATWMPNSILKKMLNENQKNLNNTQFIFDQTKYLVKKWYMVDNTSNILIIDKNMKVIYKKSGKVSAQEQKKILNLIKNSI